MIKSCTGVAWRVVAIAALVFGACLARAGEKIQFSGRSTISTNNEVLPWNEKKAFPSFSLKGKIGPKAPDPEGFYVPPSENSSTGLTKKQKEKMEDDKWWILKTPEKNGDKAKRDEDSDKDQQEKADKQLGVDKERKTLLEKFLTGEEDKDSKTKANSRTNEVDLVEERDKKPDYATSGRSPFGPSGNDAKSVSPLGSTTNRTDNANRVDLPIARASEQQQRNVLPQNESIRNETFRMLGMSPADKAGDDSYRSGVTDKLLHTGGDVSRSGSLFGNSSTPDLVKGSFDSGNKNDGGSFAGPSRSAFGLDPQQRGNRSLADFGKSTVISGNNAFNAPGLNLNPVQPSESTRPAFERPAVLDVPKRKF